MFKNQYGGGGYSQDILDKIKKIISMGSTRSTRSTRSTSSTRSTINTINDIFTPNKQTQETYQDMIQNINEYEFIKVEPYPVNSSMQLYTEYYSRRQNMLLSVCKNININDTIFAHCVYYDNIKYISIHNDNMYILISVNDSASNVMSLNNYIEKLGNRKDINIHEKLTILYKVIRDYIETIDTYVRFIYSNYGINIVANSSVYIDNNSEMYIVPKYINKDIIEQYVAFYYPTIMFTQNTFKNTFIYILTQCINGIIVIFRQFNGMLSPDTNASMYDIITYKLNYTAKSELILSNSLGKTEIFNYNDFLSDDSVFVNYTTYDFMEFYIKYIDNIVLFGIEPSKTELLLKSKIIASNSLKMLSNYFDIKQLHLSNLIPSIIIGEYKYRLTQVYIPPERGNSKILITMEVYDINHIETIFTYSYYMSNSDNGDFKLLVFPYKASQNTFKIPGAYSHGMAVNLLINNYIWDNFDLVYKHMGKQANSEILRKQIINRALENFKMYTYEYCYIINITESEYKFQSRVINIRLFDCMNGILPSATKYYDLFQNIKNEYRELNDLKSTNSLMYKNVLRYILCELILNIDKLFPGETECDRLYRIVGFFISIFIEHTDSEKIKPPMPKVDVFFPEIISELYTIYNIVVKLLPPNELETRIKFLATYYVMDVTICWNIFKDLIHLITVRSLDVSGIKSFKLITQIYLYQNNYYEIPVCLSSDISPNKYGLYSTVIPCGMLIMKPCEYFEYLPFENCTTETKFTYSIILPKLRGIMPYTYAHIYDGVQYDDTH